MKWFKKRYKKLWLKNLFIEYDSNPIRRKTCLLFSHYFFNFKQNFKLNKELSICFNFYKINYLQIQLLLDCNTFEII
jgi:hypothetical protein